jgi:3'-5' exoribonuclease
MHFQQATSQQVRALSDIWSCLLFIRQPALRQFFLQVLSDPQLVAGLYQGRASQSFHHAYEGGLLDHCHEVAMTAAMLAWRHQLAIDEICVAFVGGLLHDIGKIAMYYNQPSGSGVAVQHEELSFMLLSAYLQPLQANAPRIFEALCGCLQANSWRRTADYLPVDLVRMADRLSTDVANWKSVFAHHPAHHWFAKNMADHRIYKRLA